jgi:hypothetical protein
MALLSPLAELFQVRYPPRRSPPATAGLKLIKRCPICGAELYEVDGKLVRKGSWGIVSYSDHRCSVFS